MRLLNTATFILSDFTGSEIPPYAILSHRWEGHEITFRELEDIKGSDPAAFVNSEQDVNTAAWSKIKGCCDQARVHGYAWIWVDSCCIDKSSSAELSEAINSMFTWYGKAGVCYAYLSDVQSTDAEMPAAAQEEFQRSRWFSRGWTLQELLAPKEVIFCAAAWQQLGNRQQLWPLISKATGIGDLGGWRTASIAQKMSWASRRETTRSEDKAYSLMGLFGVNMPPLYGEGENAFIRLQLEILRISDDESIFAWADDKDTSGGLLARSPKAFQNSGDFRRLDVFRYEKAPYSMTNKGIRVELPVCIPEELHLDFMDADDTFLAFLSCRAGQNYSMLAILLRRIKGNQFTRVSSAEIIRVPGWNDNMQARIESSTRMVQVKQEDDSELSFRGLPQYRFSVALDVLEFKGFQVTSRWTSWSTSCSSWDDGEARDEETIVIDRMEGKDSVTAALEFTSRQSSRFENYDSHPALAYAESDRFVLVFNMYARRARLGILLPSGTETMRAMLRKWMQPGDWMTNCGRVLPTRRLVSGTKVTAQLVGKPSNLWLRSYQAEVSFEDPVELHTTQIPDTPSDLLVEELPNNEVESTEKRNSMSIDPGENYYPRGFLLQKESEVAPKRREFWLSRPLHQVAGVSELADNEVFSFNSEFADAAKNYSIRGFLEHRDYLDFTPYFDHFSIGDGRVQNEEKLTQIK
ncbi:hypothetical protein LZ554_004258 [Drepanopeziza brunnea f. sp. 'monogermtubi']|nr:hypothetical protein LZ554_004258 [Drepanopeziza brunnea f. sp. 'monogermtubi']